MTESALQYQIDDLKRRADSGDRSAGRQWDAINGLGQADVKLDERQVALEGDLSEVKDDVKSVKRAMWSLAVALIIAALGIIGVLVSLLGAGGHS